MSTSTEKKQNYLYDEIIGQEYDAEMFMNFMAEAKEDGTNVDNWNMVELVNIVSEFKEKYPKQKLEQQNHYANDYNSQPHYQTSNYDTNNPYGQENLQNTTTTVSYEKPVVHEAPINEKKENVNKQNDFGGFQQGFGSQNFNQQNLQQQPPIKEQATQNYSMQQSYGQAKSPQQETKSNTNNNIGAQNIKNSQANQQQPQQDMNASKNKPSFAETIQFDPGLSSLIKNQDPFSSFNNNQKSNMPVQTFENNHIWGNPLANNNSSTNNNWNASFQQDPFAMTTSTKNADPFAMTSQGGNNSDPFAMFQSTTGTPSQQIQSDKNDPFSSFFQPQTQQKQQQSQLQKIPSQPPAPVSQNPQTQKANDIDIEDFLFGGASNNKGQKPNQQMSTSAVVAAPIVAATATAAGTKVINSNNNAAQQAQNKQTTQTTNTAAQKQPQKQTNQSQDLAQQIKEPVQNNNKGGNDEKFKSEKTCKKSVQTVVGVKPEVVVSIIEHEIVSGSLFSIGGSNLAIYHVKTMPFNWTVKRKYNDFIWLRNILIKMYPGIPIPPLPGKTMKSLDDKLVQRRKGYFESFLFEILSQPDLKSSKFMTDFLSIADDKIFKQRVKETEKCNRPRNLNEVETTTGKIVLNKNPDCNTHSQILSDYFTENDQCYEKLKKLSKQLMDAYGHVGSILHQMGDTFAQLFTNVQAYDQKAMQSAQIKELEETYKIMNNMCVMQANSFSDQIKIFQNHFYNFFKFHKDNLTGLKEVAKTRNELNQILVQKNSNESSFSNIFRSSRECVYHPSKILKELDEQVGYYNEMMLQGTRKILHNRANTYSKHFMTYCNLQKSIVTEMGTVWQDISDHFNNVLKNEIGKKRIEIMKKVS